MADFSRRWWCLRWQAREGFSACRSVAVAQNMCYSSRNTSSYFKTNHRMLQQIIRRPPSLDKFRLRPNRHT